MTINLSPEIERRLKNEALRRGLDICEYAANLIAEHLPPTQEADDSQSVDPPSLRGVAPIELPRQVLFTDTVSARLEDLPRWHPHVSLDRVAREADDE